MIQRPEIKKEHQALRRAYFNLFSSPDAEKILDDLDHRFNGTTIRNVDKVMDVNASIAAAGAREVLLYIDFMMRNEDATT